MQTARAPLGHALFSPFAGSAIQQGGDGTTRRTPPLSMRSRRSTIRRDPTNSDSMCSAISALTVVDLIAACLKKKKAAKFPSPPSIGFVRLKPDATHADVTRPSLPSSVRALRPARRSTPCRAPVPARRPSAGPAVAAVAVRPPGSAPAGNTRTRYRPG